VFHKGNVQYGSYNPIGIPRFFGTGFNRQNQIHETPYYILIFNKLSNAKNIGLIKMRARKTASENRKSFRIRENDNVLGIKRHSGNEKNK
jgi:hypothetical protein